MCVVARLVNVKMVTISNLSTTGYLNNKTRTIPTPNAYIGALIVHSNEW
jgi:hypothetical protein